MTDITISQQAIKDAKARLNYEGESVTSWARRHGIHLSTAYAVLSGQSNCLRGEAHRAAVLLGIKAGNVSTVSHS